MKHKVTVITERKKRGLFGTKTVREKQVIQVDGKTYRWMKRQEKEQEKERDRQLIERIAFYHWITGRD